MDEMLGLYGSPVPRFEAIDWPKLRSLKYWSFASYFDNAKVASVINGVELIDSGEV